MWEEGLLPAAPIPCSSLCAELTGQPEPWSLGGRGWGAASAQRVRRGSRRGV